MNAIGWSEQERMASSGPLWPANSPLSRIMKEFRA
jgi:hypothetical protein